MAPRQGSTDIEAGGAGAVAEAGSGEAATATAGAGGGAGAAAGTTAAAAVDVAGVVGTGLAAATRSFRGALVIPDSGGPPQEGSIVVQPASAPGYVVVPRDHPLGSSSSDFDGDGGTGGGVGGGGGAGPAINSSRQPSASSLVNISWDSPRGGRRGNSGGLGEEKSETTAGERATTSRTSGVNDGLGGVVFGGNTQEFREAEEAAARMAIERAGAEGSATAAAVAPAPAGGEAGSAPQLQDV